MEGQGGGEAQGVADPKKTLQTIVIYCMYLYYRDFWFENIPSGNPA
jgi:hypothetical protein